MKVLITGKYGVFVKKLVEKFYKEGAEIYLLTGESSARSKYPHVFETYHFRYDSDSVKHVLDSVSPDIVIFTGAYDENLNQKNTRRESMYYMSGLVNVLMASQMLECPLFVYLSSHEVFGNSYMSPVDETAPVTPVSNRGIMIAQGENLVQRYGETTKLDVLILRLDHMYWIPEKKEDVQEVHARLCLEAVRDRKVSASAKKIFSSVFISDAVYALYEICMAKERRHLIYQITSGEEENEIEIARTVQELCGEKVVIKDNTVGVTERNVMSGARTEEEFGITVKSSGAEMTEKILRYMEDHQKSFLSPEERQGGAVRSIWKKIYRGFWKTVPFLENAAVFLIVFMLNNRVADSVYFQKIDLFLLYVVLFGMFYGKKQAILSSVLSVGAYIFRQQYYRLGIDILIDFNTYIWMAQLFIVGMSVGHLKDSLRIVREDKDEEIEYLSGQLNDIYDINSSNLKVKNILEDHILDYDNTLGILANVGERLGKLKEGDVLMEAVEVLSENLGTKDVAIYKVSNADYCRLLIATTDKAKLFGKSLKYSEMEDVTGALGKRQVYVNRALKQNRPMMADGLYEGNDLKYIIFIWNLTFEKMSLHEINFFRVLGYTIQNAVERDDIYQDAIRDRRYIADTNILNAETFEKLLEKEKEASGKAYMEFSLLQVKGKPFGAKGTAWNRAELLSIENRLLGNLRDTDSVGVGSDGHLYVLLANTSGQDSEIVVQRLRKHGIECGLKEGL